jgi:hypothetical protein
MSALDDALDILTNYTGMFLPERFPLVKQAAAELTELKAMAKQVGEENTNLINTIHAQRVELDETRSVINEALDLLETPEARQGRIVGPAYRKLVDVIRKYPEG